MRLTRWRVGHRSDGRVEVGVRLLRFPGVGTLRLRVRLSPDDARALAHGVLRHADDAEARARG